jgi:hypothetical protein
VPGLGTRVKLRLPMQPALTADDPSADTMAHVPAGLLRGPTSAQGS